MLLGLFLMLIGIGGSIFLVENRTSFLPLATASSSPSDVSISNVSDTSVTVSWLTQSPVAGLVKVAKRGLMSGSSMVAYDVRDEGGVPVARFVHSVTIGGLDPLTAYEFVILSKNKEYRNDKFSFNTGATLATPEQIIEPAFGMLLDLKNEPVEEALVLASFDGSQNVSAVVSKGSWLLPLGTIRSADNARYYIPGRGDSEKIAFLHPTGNATVVTTIDNDSPLPPVQIGKAYDFRLKHQVNLGTIIAQSAPDTTSSDGVTSSDAFQITSPKKDAGIPSGKPAIKGTGIAGKSVILTITGKNISPISEKESISKYNTWMWVAKTSLPPDEYTVTAVSYDKNNKPVVLNQKFTILKSGSAVLQAATPAASLTPTPLPSASAEVATSTPIPTTGTTEVTIVFVGLGLLFIFFGFSTIFIQKPNKNTVPQIGNSNSENKLI